MKAGIPREQADNIIKEIENRKLTPVPMYGVERTVIAVIGEERDINIGHFESLPGVEKVMRVLKPYKLVSLETKPEKTIIEVNGMRIGDETQVISMAGPCAVESVEQMDKAAADLAAMGVKILRGGAFKPRTGPYAFNGLGEEGLEILRKTADKHGMAIITEVLDVRDLDKVCEKADILQIGARNMQNYPLLTEIGKTKKPVMLKRSMTGTIEELLLAAEYILSNGNPNVILCERGIRTFEKITRNTLAIATIPIVKELSHLPIIVDASHGTGKRSLVGPMTKAGIAAGADGFMIEVHPDPASAKCDAQQQLTPKTFGKLYENLKPLVKALNKELDGQA